MNPNVLRNMDANALRNCLTCVEGTRTESKDRIKYRCTNLKSPAYDTTVGPNDVCDLFSLDYSNPRVSPLDELTAQANPTDAIYIHLPIKRFELFQANGYRIACFCNLPGLVVDIRDTEHNYIYHFVVFPNRHTESFKCHRCGQVFVLDFA